MELPPRFEETFDKNKVYRLKKVLYRLKQSPSAWSDRFAGTIRGMGCRQNLEHHTLFIRNSMEGKLAVLQVYVDDIIMTRDGHSREEKIEGVVNERI